MNRCNQEDVVQKEEWLCSVYKGKNYFPSATVSRTYPKGKRR
jgi:hypothetical protein